MFEKSIVAQILYNNHYVDSDTGCYIYTGDVDPCIGYGRVLFNGIRYHTHRLSACIYHGLDLDDPKQFACHKCKNRACWNPLHLYVGDNKSNQLDAVDNKCKKGHDLIEPNILWRKRPNGEIYRNCRMCHNDRSLKAYHKATERKR